MKVKLDEGAKMPTRAHELDAGYDLYSRETRLVPANGSAVFYTGVHVQIPAGYYGSIRSKSGLNINNSITSDGVIDSGYTGMIVVKLYNHSVVGYEVKKGDKISQLIIQKFEAPELELVDELEATERGNNGFGSSGR